MATKERNNIYVIFGSIGVGKSTMCKGLEEKGIRVLEESWVDSELLKLYYENPSRYAFRLQMMILEHYSLIEEPSQEILVIERSPRDTIDVFIKENKKNMTEREYELCKSYGRLIMERPIWKNATYMKLVASYSSCVERVKKRNRETEKSMTEIILKNIYERYEKMHSDCVFVNDMCNPQKIVSEMYNFIIKEKK